MNLGLVCTKHVQHVSSYCTVIRRKSNAPRLFSFGFAAYPLARFPLDRQELDYAFRRENNRRPFAHADVPPTASESQAAGVWITLAGGYPGNPVPASMADFQFPAAAPQQVAVDQLNGVGTVHAGTSGGDVYFGGLGTPVLLNLSDGAGLHRSGKPTTGATGRGLNGTSAGARVDRAKSPAGRFLRAQRCLKPRWQIDATREQRPCRLDRWMIGDSLSRRESIPFPSSGWWVISLGPAAESLAIFRKRSALRTHFHPGCHVDHTGTDLTCNWPCGALCVLRRRGSSRAYPRHKGLSQ